MALDNQRLPTRTEVFSVTNSDLIHLVRTTDTSADPTGTSKFIKVSNTPWTTNEGYEPVNNIAEFNALVAAGVSNQTWNFLEDITLISNPTLPENTNLIFTGGKMLGGGFTLTGNKTTIFAGNYQIFDNDITFGGTWNIPEAKLEWFGVGTDGTSNASQAIERAQVISKVLAFPPAVKLDAMVTFTSDIHLKGAEGGTVIGTGISGVLFSSSSDVIEITGFEGTFITNPNTFLEVTGNASYVNVSNNNLTFTADDINNYLLFVNYAGATITNLRVNNNIIDNATLFYSDDITGDNAYFETNVIDNAPRFAVRINALDDGDTYGSIQNVLFTYNQINNINGNLTDKTNVARCFQGRGFYTELSGNSLIGAESLGAPLTSAANFAYLRRGNYNIFNNLIVGIKTIDSRAIIDDKGTYTTNEFYQNIYNNVFDQTGILLAETPESCVKVNEARNVSIYSNKFYTLKCYAVRVYHSVDTGNYPENTSIYNNHIYSTDFPVVFQVFQNIKNTTIFGNVLHSISNSTTISVNSDTRNRLVDIYQSFNNGGSIENVSIRNNDIIYSDGIICVALMYKNAAAPTSGIDNVKVISNNVFNGSTTGALARFVGAALDVNTITNVDLVNNVGYTAMTETIGTEPADIRKQNNLV